MQIITLINIISNNYTKLGTPNKIMHEKDYFYDLKLQAVDNFSFGEKVLLLLYKIMNLIFTYYSPRPQPIL